MILTYVLAFLAAHRAFIITDNFFRMAALIGLRPVVFLETAAPFLRPGLPFCFAHQAFFAAPILARAAGLIRRRFLVLAGLAWLLLGGRPRRTGWEGCVATFRLMAGNVKESGNDSPTRDLQMAADRIRPHTLCGPVVSPLFSVAARC